MKLEVVVLVVQWLEERLNESVARLLDLIFTATQNRQPGYRYDVEGHHQLARKMVASSAVLLKNEVEFLPIPKNQTIALIGALAKEPRYQGPVVPTLTPPGYPVPLMGLKHWA